MAARWKWALSACLRCSQWLCSCWATWQLSCCGRLSQLSLMLSPEQPLPCQLACWQAPCRWYAAVAVSELLSILELTGLRLITKTPFCAVAVRSHLHHPSWTICPRSPSQVPALDCKLHLLFGLDSASSNQDQQPGLIFAAAYLDLPKVKGVQNFL